MGASEIERGEEVRKVEPSERARVRPLLVKLHVAEDLGTGLLIRKRRRRKLVCTSLSTLVMVEVRSFPDRLKRLD